MFFFIRSLQFPELIWSFHISLIDKWSPALQIRTVLLSIQALLSAPNPDDPLANDVAEKWKEDEAGAIKTGKFPYLSPFGPFNLSSFYPFPFQQFSSRMDSSLCLGIRDLIEYSIFSLDHHSLNPYLSLLFPSISFSHRLEIYLFDSPCILWIQQFALSKEFYLSFITFSLTLW